jgi:hypothetical protein
MRRAAVVALAATAVLLPASDATAQLPQICLGDLSAGAVKPEPGPPLRFGITPAGEAGAIGPAIPAVPGTFRQDLQALRQLRPNRRTPFVIRLNRLFWSLGDEGLRRYERLARRYTDHGFLVEIQLRYHPTAVQEGDIPAWTRFVRDAVDRFGSNPGVVAMQVTNEVNFPISPDSSDGAYQGARDALIQGVEAASDEVDQRGFQQLQIGFNWFYRMDPFTESSFWSYLRDHGGPAFLAAVDWVGLDAYPGTIFPPLELPGGYRDGMVNAMSVLRDCFLPIAGIGSKVPIHIEENGWPTGPLRGEQQQVDALREMTGAVDEFRGTYNVTDYRWFDLRDHDSSSLNFQHHYGLLLDDYTPKPAFAAYAAQVAGLSG